MHGTVPGPCLACHLGRKRRHQQLLGLHRREYRHLSQDHALEQARPSPGSGPRAHVLSWKLDMSELAILGGTATRTRPFEPWPQYTGSDARRLLEVLESRNWGGYPFPNQFANDFAQKFADYHGAKYGC